MSIVGCGGHNAIQSRPDADAGSIHDAPVARDGDAAAETQAPDATCGEAGAIKKTNGQSCGCNSDCSSGFCVDGVCCDSACQEGCRSCALPGMAGTCASIPAGAKPRTAAACVATSPSMCGLDGFCDGAGACRKFPAGTLCQPGTCDGDAVVGARACDGNGLCKPGPTQICAPFSCNTATGRCFDTCSATGDCVSGHQCVNASCGPKMKGATCVKNADCASGFCADGLCCNVACQGACVSCSLAGREGTCWPIDNGAPDPRAVCKDQGPATCGTTGACDGFGGCAKYAAETQCIAPSCAGNRLNTAGTCDGLGSCRAPGVENCSPFRCSDGACNANCGSDADCDVGRACVNHKCGPKQNGQVCAVDSECVSAHCVDGVCCDGVCTGGCRSCNLPSSPGKCTTIPAGATDPRAVCKDQGAGSCGNNGKCDGSGGCQRYNAGTICAGESCGSNVYKPPSTCNATGQCVAPDSLPCSPYVCNGSKCFNACSGNAQCLTPNVCNGNSCGKKTNGASCSGGVECGSGFCAQGVCCNTACTTACKSCALSGSLGSCTNVATGSADPAGTCSDMGAASCGTNGKCEAGACQKYAKGIPCKGSACPTDTTMFTPGSSCDGAGKCVTPSASSCFPYKCGASVCKGTCTANADCASPAVCTNGSCGLKGLGKTCADKSECLSGFCAQGVCCNVACNGACQSCGLSASLGTCSNVAAGATDPQGTCKDLGAANCSTDGVCDGKGACRLYAAGTQCVAPSCPAGMSTLTQARTCDGIGNCKAATTIACAPYQCNGTSACNAACTSDADCLAPSICDPKTNLCGSKKRLGQACAASSDCLTGNYCVDGVCCAAMSCGMCQACNIAGSAGSCANVGSGAAEPHGGCAANPPCGNTGRCNGGGACEQASTSVSCGTVSCTGSTYTPLSHCNGSGACATATTSSCSPYVCGAGACKTTCTADADCLAPFTCQGTGTTMSCALKINGLPCTTASQCISGACVDGVCCGADSCPFCQACNVSGKAGACAPVAAGTNAPPGKCPDAGVAMCSTNGKCDGAGGCQRYADGTVCSAATCPVGTANFTSAGACTGGACKASTSSCLPLLCNASNACGSPCTSDGNCPSGSYCNAAGGCVPVQGNGAACARGTQCSSGHCVDGVCCGSASCPACQACNVGNTAGACAPVSAGTPAPPTFCSDQGLASCGTNGLCDGKGGCQTYMAGLTCSQPSCPGTGSTLTSAGTCAGGVCSKSTSPCDPFMCDQAAGACRRNCTGNGDCVAGDFCQNPGPNGACVGKSGNGVSCTGDAQCTSNHCVEGVCCGMASCPSCQSCAVPGSLGTCTNLAAGSFDPTPTCKDNGSLGCGTNGRCNGSGGCQFYGSSTMCAAASCPATASTLSSARFCDGAGNCGAATTTSCGAYMCDGSQSCLTSCTASSQCSTGNTCTAPVCGP